MSYARARLAYSAYLGFLQLALDTGLAGLLLFTAALLSFTSRARALLKTDPGYGQGFAFVCSKKASGTSGGYSGAGRLRH